MNVRLTIALLLASGTLGAQSTPLKVTRTSPTGDALVTSRVTVTFDRPVAGSLDRTVDAGSIVHVEPAIPGKLEWRDPVTIRLVPSALLVPGREYTVTIANTFKAMDGSALAEPYRFSFRVGGPTLLTGSPVGRSEGGRTFPAHITPTQKFDVVYSSPVDLTKLSATAFVEFNNACAGEKMIRLAATNQRRIRDNDPYAIKEAGSYDRDHTTDSLRRVVQLTPQSPLPHGCAGDLVIPAEVSENATRAPARWSFATYGELRLSKITCGWNNDTTCATGPLTVEFTNPVRGAEVLRRVHLLPAAKFVIRDTISDATSWVLDGKLQMHTNYAVVVDTSIRDIFGQPLRGNPAMAYRTTGYDPSLSHASGRITVERVGFRTLAVQHVNVDTLVVTMAQIPDTLEAMMLSLSAWGNDSLWAKLRGASVQRIGVRSIADRPMITGIRLPTLNAMRPRTPTLFAVKVAGVTGKKESVSPRPISLIQVTDLGVHAKIGVSEGVVWVTGISDGSIKAGATVVVHNTRGKILATAKTDAQGIARFAKLVDPDMRAAPASGGADESEEMPAAGFEGYVSVTSGTDRAITAINEWDPDLAPYHFNVSGASFDERIAVAGAVFTERGIYKPGERLYSKAIVRDGALGSLRAAPRGDSVKFVFHDREGGVLRETTVRLSEFGTADCTLDLGGASAVGEYQLNLQAKRLGQWRSIGRTSYRVAEYRPPEFLVDLAADKTTRFPGDKLTATAQARYLFGAPMGRAEIIFSARQVPVYAWELEIPGVDGWYIGDSGSWWEDTKTETADVFASKADTLDATGTRAYTIDLPESSKGRASRVTIDATVTDVNRQVVGTSASTIVHPAEFYVAARTKSDEYFWKAGTPQAVSVVAVRPDGQKVTGVRIAGTIVRREWHRVRREREGVSEVVGDWVSDTVAHCAITSAATEVPCTFTPKEGGSYTLTLSATDRRGHVAKTTMQRWASGAGWVPWSDETQFKMDVIPDRTRYAIGDTATIMFASPFVDAEAWITVEREGLIEQRRLRITSGSTTLKFPISEAYAPNAFVSIIVARGRSAKPGYADDLGRPTIRVGYAELRVTPEAKRLTVTVSPEKADYRPADTARVRVQVRDKQGRGARSEVTLWAVDEGVLALTGFKTPDPLDLIYRERGLGMRLASNMSTIAPQVPEGEKGWREPGGGGGVAGADILRSRFKTTAFFLGSVVTDAQGNATATAALPDNITTFRVMAVAVTATDRYGKGESKMLVTRPLIARQALPRFVRPGDDFTGGAVINRRDGAAVGVNVRAAATGATLNGGAEQSATLAAQRGAEVRFPFKAARADSASFRFDVSDGKSADAVRVTIPVRPAHHPVVYTLAGSVRDTATIDLPLPAGIDPERSRLSLSIGVSPLATVRGMLRELRVYEYYCSEQVISAAVPIIALFRAQKERGGEQLKGNPRAELARAVDMLSGRQRVDGGIGYWSAQDWTSAWLSAYAGIVMLDARDAGAGVKVDTVVLRRLADYLTADLHGKAEGFSPVASWMEGSGGRLREEVAAVDFLSRYGKPDVGSENELVRNSAQLKIEDRTRLAEVLMRRKQTTTARTLMEPTWALLRVEGRRAQLPDSARANFYFDSRMRPYARILTATLAIDPEHAMVWPLAETLAQQTRLDAAGWFWNTQDFASAVSALSMLERVRRAQPERTIHVRAGDRVLFAGAANVQAAMRDSSIALTGLLANTKSLRLSLDAGPGQGSVYYYLSVTEVPVKPPVTPEDRGIQVERWYERVAGGAPLSTVAEGELVRVRLRVTVPAMRYFVVLDDALPAGLEAIDLSLRTASASPGPGVAPSRENTDHEDIERSPWYGSWDSGWWSPFDHRELRDDRVVYSANLMWPGTYTATYIARATTPGTFIRPPAHAEEMYNPAVNGRSDGGTFVVTAKPGAR
ncbi:MAG: alpha-2-macroglobulin domain protein 2 [Gemmatimonadetes bacterium]|nr:alpha-2-macroglobulin domain protein 2 [Gemmatimonadota bacterium]